MIEWPSDLRQYTIDELARYCGGPFPDPLPAEIEYVVALCVQAQQISGCLLSMRAWVRGSQDIPPAIAAIIRPYQRFRPATDAEMYMALIGLAKDL